MAAHKPVGEELREVMRLAIARREPFSRWRQIANDDAEEIAREVRVPLASIEDDMGHSIASMAEPQERQW